MRRNRVGTREIASMGYDALSEVLEIEFQRDGQVWQYTEVPEDLWYRLRGVAEIDGFYYRHICGQFKERAVYRGRRRAGYREGE